MLFRKKVKLFKNREDSKAKGKNKNYRAKLKNSY